VHRVRAGETLFSIARRYQVTVERLKALNNLRTSVLQIGARLIVQVGRATATQQQ
jgi:LysM repeat protein